MRVIGGQVFDLNEGFVKKDLFISGEKIVETDDGGDVLDAAGCYVIPWLCGRGFQRRNPRRLAGNGGF